MIEILKRIAWRQDVLAVEKRYNGKKQPAPVSGLEQERYLKALQQHLDGTSRIGAYTTDPKTDSIQWLCLDIDGGETHSPKSSLETPVHALDQICNLLMDAEVPHYSEISGSGDGYHLWIFFDGHTLARDARDWMRTQILSRLMGLRMRDGSSYEWKTQAGIEIYPKQDEMEGQGYGNLVWLPYHGGRQPLYGGNFFREVTDESMLIGYSLTHRAPPREERKTFTYSAGSLSANAKQVRRYLSYLDPDMAYDDWLRVGMALQHWSAQEGNEEGYTLWCAWSAQSTQFSEPYNRKKWTSFRLNRQSSVTLGTIIHMARDAGMTEIKRGSHVELARYVLHPNDSYDGISFYSFNNDTGIWEILPEIKIKKRITDLDGYQYVTGKKPKTLSISENTVKGTVSVARVEARPIDPLDWNASVGGVATMNGWLTTKGIEPLTRDHMARFRLDMEYDPHAKCPMWDKYLKDTVDRDTARLLQEFVGASILGVAWRYQAALFLFGDGGNGKSVFMDVMRSLFPSDTVSAAKITQLTDRGTKGSLEGKRLNIQAELPTQDLMEGSDFKDLVTGDLVSVRLPYNKEITTFQCICGFVFSGNEYPRTTATDRGFWRRVRIASFDRFFTPDEIDRELASKIIASEREGILAWAIRGAERLEESKSYSDTKRGAERKAEWSRLSNPVQLFVLRACRPVADGAPKTVWASGAQLYENYKQWCSIVGRYPVHDGRFGKALSKMVSKSRTSKHVAYALEVRPQSEWMIGDCEE